MLRTTSIIKSLTMLTIVVSLAPFPCLAVVHGDVELLKTVALQHKANFESLLTWKGEVFEEKVSTRGDSYDYMIRNKCIFAYDQLQNAVRWNKEPQENRLVVDGKSLRDINAFYNSAMIKEQSSYQYSALGLRDGKETYHLVIGDLMRARDWSDFCLDPRYFLAGSGGGHSIYGRLMFLYDGANNPKLHEWYVKRVGDLVTLEVQFGENNDKIEKYVFDLSAAGNLVEYYNKTPSAENAREYTYEEKSGVWILKSFKRTNITHREDGDLRLTRTINWSKSVVNIPFEEDEFTLEKLGLKYSDDIHDHNLGMRYQYKQTLDDSEMLDVLDTADVPEGMIAPKNSGINETTDQTDATVKMDSPNDVDTEAEKDMLQIPAATSTGRETNGTSTYIYIIIFAIIIGLAGIAYKLTRRFRKE